MFVTFSIDWLLMFDSFVIFKQWQIANGYAIYNQQRGDNFYHSHVCVLCRKNKICLLLKQQLRLLCIFKKLKSDDNIYNF